tara:strand:- start:746 stop:1276 length:531 start_codon:yes stop_codon:yes gene_type:complete
MKLLTLKFYFLLIYLISFTSAYSIEQLDIKNLLIHKQSKKIDNIEFENLSGNIVNLQNFKGKLIIINFWATWCAPCREEMPSLDKLQIDEELENLKIFPINVGQEKISKSEEFYKDFKIKNLDIYHDQSLNLPNKFLLRGLPTTVFIDKNGLEFARAVGSIDFQNEKFINWLKKYD